MFIYLISGSLLKLWYEGNVTPTRLLRLLPHPHYSGPHQSEDGARFPAEDHEIGVELRSSPSTLITF
jgi:hypothetical protein